MGGDARDVVTRTGWLRTLGGIDVYLAVRARSSDVQRTDMDRTVADGALRVSPAARGCIYLIPEAHLPLALAHARSLWRPRTTRELDKAGTSWSEVADIAEAVLAVAARGPLTTAEIRRGLPAGTVRGLGVAGRRVGLSSPLPVALRELEFTGRLERTLADGRLDTERYLWRVVPGGRESAIVGYDAEDRRMAELCQLFLRVAGPATVAQMTTWIGVSQRAVKAALAKLPVVPITVRDAAQPTHVALSEDVAALKDGLQVAQHFTFLPFEDPLIVTHGGPRVFIAEQFWQYPVDSWGGSRPTTLGQARHVGQRPLLHGDRLIGFWEYDADDEHVVCGLFEPLSRRDNRALQEARTGLYEFVRDQLGHARSFSLDTTDAVRGRAQVLRAMVP